MTKKEAYDKLPPDAKWSCSFGYPGEGGFTEIYRTPDGNRFQMQNGYFGDEWSFREMGK